MRIRPKPIHYLTFNSGFVKSIDPPSMVLTLCDETDITSPWEMWFNLNSSTKYRSPQCCSVTNCCAGYWTNFDFKKSNLDVSGPPESSAFWSLLRRSVSDGTLSRMQKIVMNTASTMIFLFYLLTICNKTLKTYFSIVKIGGLQEWSLWWSKRKERVEEAAEQK